MPSGGMSLQTGWRITSEGYAPRLSRRFDAMPRGGAATAPTAAGIGRETARGRQAATMFAAMV